MSLHLPHAGAILEARDDQDMINKVKNCACCKKYEGAPPIAKLQKLPCSGPGELLHIDFTKIEETVGLH